MTRLIFGLLICVFVTASFVDTRLTKYAFHEDYNDMQQNTVDVSRNPNLLDLYRTYFEDNKGNRRDVEDDPENWTGRWMPDKLGDPTPPPKIYSHNEQESHKPILENHHDMHMGHASPDCDDAKTNLTIDWDYSVAMQSCYGHHLEPSRRRICVACEQVPMAYKAAHKCMNETIEYDNAVPLYGPHRPLWPAYGEYLFLPKQRWLHSLEHGAIVMLYHPCANPLEVKRLKQVVAQCLWRHVITPSSDLDEDYPMAILTWGCKLTMAYVNPLMVARFIKMRALQGPEMTPEDGQFKDMLVKPSEVVSDPTDSVICPEY